MQQTCGGLMSKLRKTVLAAFLSLHGCLAFGTVLDYKLMSEETTIDPVTGDVTRTFHWQYTDGYETTTTKTIRRGEDVEQRQGDRPTPGLRFGEP
jgi:hypothetical protein